MRNIEHRIIRCFLHQETVRLSKRDHIEFDGTVTKYYLWDTMLARYSQETPNVLTLGTPDHRFHTNTTKSRLNAFADYFNFPRVCQKSFLWSWSDGIPFGPTYRIFTRRPL